MTPAQEQRINRALAFTAEMRQHEQDVYDGLVEVTVAPPETIKSLMRTRSSKPKANQTQVGGGPSGNAGVAFTASNN